MARTPSEEETQNNKNSKKQDPAPPPPPPPIAFLETAIQSVAGPNYKFGDYSKKALSELTGKDLTSDTYEFGDITKNLVNQAGKTILGKDTYVFGDLTRGVISDVERSLEQWRGPSLNELPIQLVRELVQTMDRPQRQATYVAMIRLLAIALLTWSFMANLCTAMAVTCAWTRASFQTVATVAGGGGGGGVWNPLRMYTTNVLFRQVFVHSYTVLRIFLDPLFLIIQGGGTVLGIWKYQRFLTMIEQDWIPRSQQDKYPILYRVAALGIAFLGNIGLSMVVTGVGILLGTAMGQLKWRWLVLPAS
jgi:hypothetical protein